MKNKGFTLIELLAVITIMGILMLVGIPAINRVIENTRKDNYVDTAKKYVNAVKRLWTTDQLFCGDNNITSAAVEDGDYYILIDSSNIDKYTELLEQGGKSSWGDRDVKGYVRVNVKFNPATGKQDVKYYIALSDKVHAIYDDKGNEVEADDLERGDLVMSLDDDSMEEIEVYPFTTGNVTTCSENSSGNVTGTDSGSGGSGSEESGVKFTIVSGSVDEIGSQVLIENEYFYIYGFEGDSVKLLAKYNLKVGGKYNWAADILTPYDETVVGVGKQQPGMRGNVESGGALHGMCLFDSNIDTYLANYKNYLISLGVNINDVRLISVSELQALGCDLSINKCTGAPKFVWSYEFNESDYNMSYWTSNRNSTDYVYAVGDHKNFGSYSISSRTGVRPVVIVPKSAF